MKRLSKLIRLNRYLQDFRLDDSSPTPICVTTGEQATQRLHSKSGDQILIALPEAKMSGGSDSYSEDLSTAIFVISPALSAGRTDGKEREQSCRLLDLASQILTKMERDSTSADCPDLCGMELASGDITPEVAIFGGWCGWSIEISIE